MAQQMKESGSDWIGIIPDDWKIVRMKACVSQRDSGSWGSDACGDSGDTICLRIADFDYSKYRFKNTPEEELTWRNYKEDVVEKLTLKKNDIVIEKSGGGEKTPVGRTVIFDKDYKALYANFCDRIRCREIVNPEFLQYIFVTFYANRFVWNYIKQTTGIQNLDLTSMLSQEKVALPSIKKQEAIVSFLNNECKKIESAYDATIKSIDEYKKLKQAVVTKAVTKGIKNINKTKNSGSVWFDEIPENWDMKKLKYMFHIKKDIAGEEGYTVLSITQKGIIPKDLSKNEGQLAANYSNYQLVAPGDFAMNHMDLLTGWVDISKYSGVTSPDYRVFVLDDATSNDSRYFLYMMQMCYSNRIFYGLGQGVSGLGRWRLQADKFLNFMIPVPPKEEQSEIADYLDNRCTEIDNLIEMKEAFLEELDNYKKSLIYEYVTGKKEVPACY